VDGTSVNQFGDNPLGYLVYTPDGHVFVQAAARERVVLFGPSPGRGQVLLETAEANTPFGFIGDSGTFEVEDGQAIHHVEFNANASAGGRQVRSVELNSDRLILEDRARGGRLEWQRIH
jgi:hypothetical protein